jgi:hypothetical protein
MRTEKEVTKELLLTEEYNSDEFDTPESVKTWQQIMGNDRLFQFCDKDFTRIPAKIWNSIKGDH